MRKGGERKGRNKGRSLGEERAGESREGR